MKIIHRIDGRIEQKKKIFPSLPGPQLARTTAISIFECGLLFGPFFFSQVDQSTEFSLHYIDPVNVIMFH